MLCCLSRRKQKSWFHLQSEKSASMTNCTNLYFGYGSNLWKAQMQSRCPTSKYLGIARLNGYRWIINKRGYANVGRLSARRRMMRIRMTTRSGVSCIALSKKTRTDLTATKVCL